MIKVFEGSRETMKGLVAKAKQKLLLDFAGQKISSREFLVEANKITGIVKKFGL